MRIVGGEARSRTLKAPSGMDTRPTLDKVREALFNILQLRVADARVLDLYAGSGALALEALSRGAREAVLCDASREACKVIRQNIEALGYESKTRLLFMPDTRALALLQAEHRQFDLIFLDPPYRMDASAAMTALLDGNLPAGDARIIVEHAAKTPPKPDARLECLSVRQYRDTCLSFFRRKQDGGEKVPLSGKL